MMKALSTVWAMLLLAGPATAADAVTGPVHQVPPVAAPASSWAGLYVGGFAGYGWGRSDATGAIDPNSVFASASSVARSDYNAAMSPGFKPGGFAGGGTIGANWQKDFYVLGVEGDFGAFNFSDSVTASVTPANYVGLTSNTTASADWLGTVRGRVGWAADRSLIYATAGVAFTDLGFRQANTYAMQSPGVENFSISNVRTGWAAGAGWEYMFTPNWSGKVEYLRLDFGTVDGTGVMPVQPPVNIAHSVDFTANLVRLGINYRFGAADSRP